MIVAGLTGSIAMGKSETARMFRELGIPVFDADGTVHRLYEKEGAAVSPIAARFPGAIVDGAVDRARLSALVVGDTAALAGLEQIVHPLVWREERAFSDDRRHAGAPLIVIDNPLLFEAGRSGEVDVIIVASAPADVQRQRALQRPGMSEEKLDAILARQMPDAEKRARAHFIVDTSKGLESARRQVQDIVRRLTGGKTDA